MGFHAQPKYPSMERQDLTQGQLGSFKFTPVDVQTNTRGDTPLFLQAQSLLRARVGEQGGFEFITEDYQNNFASLASQQSLGGTVQNFSPRLSPGFSSATTCRPATPPSDPGYFNRHIKPDLEDSRLKLGPAAFRSAVNGNSPEKNFSQSRPRAEVGHLASGLHLSPFRELYLSLRLPQSNLTSFYLPSVPQQPFWTMDPTVQAFEPSSEATVPTIALDYSTIVRCLVSEQESHERVQKSLEQAQLHIKKLEGQLEKAKAREIELTLTLKSLNGIIDRLESRLDVIGEKSAEPTTGGDNNGEGDIMTERQDKNTAALPITTSLTDDSAQSITTGKTVSEAEADSSVDSSSMIKQLTPNVDHNDAFNLDLLLKHKRGTIPKWQTRALRKHFDIDSISEDSVDKSAEESFNPDELVGISPPKASGIRDRTNDVDMATTTKATPTKKEQVTTPIQGISNDDNKTATPTKYSPAKLYPESFLSKYQKAKKQPATLDSADETPFKTEFLRNNIGKPSLSSVATMHSLNARAPKVVDPTAPYELSIKWQINKESPLYEEEEIDRAIKWQPADARYGIFWKHPVRYLDHSSKNLFRTVMIDYIPKTATYNDVLGQISGGSLEKIEMVPAIGNVTDYQTARVVFNFEIGASTTANFARDHGMKIKDQPLRVWQVLTQTYPKNMALDRDIFDNGFTRILLINNASQEALAMIPTKLQHFQRSIVDFGETFDRYPMVEFTSVAVAIQAMEVLVADPNFSGAEFDFDEDPCGEPYPFAH
ncbi:uncharacterized protein HMPREF1541_06892 [Cyphellophora europaea CBS 101466]|uniref:Uncharacterized protein n=1 Tax=Cyphellophora europaea (strain CBS 101466) TaxID=1220924 RepID=W2RQR3_CYPE1|nr:uncharacterized protein HMPREF1541_06892 [Cyphellophora europaea CBS 101466]ETN38851.1 hypothetical protein HMPREF1541_06892 [Cyphellophora europaea CBS 101466]